MGSEIREKSSIWHKNFSDIPCFKNSYLYGITSGIIAGVTYFMFTSKPRIASHVAVTVFATTTLGYWTYCRHKWETDENTVALMKEFLRDRLDKEGTIQEHDTVYDIKDTKPSTV